jgi:hypothetical protein
MKSKIIQISTSIHRGETFIVALCEDGSVWTSEDFKSFELFEEPCKAASKETEQTS